MFGPHLILEGYNCKKVDLLNNRETILNLLSEFPSKLDMNIIMQPQVMYYDGGDIPEDSGISGFVIIAESHIAIHTFPQKGFFTVDIFSCKPFNTNWAIEFILNFFEPEGHEHKVLERGKEFPRSIGRASSIVSEERSFISK